LDSDYKSTLVALRMDGGPRTFYATDWPALQETARKYGWVLLQKRS